MRSTIRLIIILTLVSALGCKMQVVETTSADSTPAPTPLPANTLIRYSTVYPETRAYGEFINTYWSNIEVEQLSLLSNGLLLPGTQTSDTSALVDHKNLLVKLLVKLNVIEQRLDAYLNYKDTTQTDVAFLYYDQHEELLRNTFLLSKTCSKEEKVLLNGLPGGRHPDLNNPNVIISKLLTKAVMIDKKSKLISSASSLNIDPQEFIKQYLREVEQKSTK